MAVDPNDAEFERELDEQTKIAEQIDNDAPIKSDPQVAGTASGEDTTVETVVEELPLVTLRTVGFNDGAYPVGIQAVGLEDELVFDNADATHDVTPQVAEQITYLDGVEVVS